jgi:oligopeptide transport system ATP-binding protein
MDKDYILKVENLKQYFPMTKDLIVKAVDDVSFQIGKGEIFGLVGETGCGKSTIARTIMSVYKPTEGDIYYKGIKISDRKEYRNHKKEIQQNIQIIFQDSAAALDPHMTVEEIIGEPLVVNHIYRDKNKQKEYISHLLHQVGMDIGYADKYPSELSGGQRQRVAIARAISIKPELIIADEPIASLDVSIQAQIINLFIKLQREEGFSFLFIAHDLSIVRFISDMIGVMRKGKLVEMASTEEIFSTPKHPYTKALLSAVPVPDPDYEKNRKIIEYKEVDK